MRLVFLLCTTLFTVSQTAPAKYKNKADGAANPAVDCLDCKDGATVRSAEGILDITKQANTCPENVKQLKLLMASTYGSCDAMDLRLTKEMMNDRLNRIRQTGGNRLDTNCKYREGHNCADISNYQDAIRNHPYNSLAPKCSENLPKCNINGKQEVCPGFYYLGSDGGQNPLDRTPYTGTRSEVNPAIPRYRSKDRNGNEFIGWDCSEYVATAMRLSGLKMICNSGATDSRDSRMSANNWWNTQRMSEAADLSGSCSCMDVVDLSDPTNKIQPGDILLESGHSSMIESINSGFLDNLTNSTSSNCEENKNESCLDEIKQKCSEDDLEPSDLKFSINHSSDIAGGIGPATMNFGDYRNSNSESWSDERRHISLLCKARLCKKHGLDETQFCQDSIREANPKQDNLPLGSSRFFKVIRHNGSERCKETPPELTNSCGKQCESAAGTGCLYSSD